MGGLVARSALHQAAPTAQSWRARVSDLIFLGTPHFGAPLERAGHSLDILLNHLPYAAPLARVGGMRSAGITDLRHGRVRHASDPAGADAPLSLPEGPRCWAIAGSLGQDGRQIRTRLLRGVLGDGLVPLDSALGRNRDANRTLHLAPDRQWVAQGVGHLALLSDVGVQSQLVRWLEPAFPEDGTAQG